MTFKELGHSLLSALQVEDSTFKASAALKVCVVVIHQPFIASCLSLNQAAMDGPGGHFRDEELNFNKGIDAQNLFMQSSDQFRQELMV